MSLVLSRKQIRQVDELAVSRYHMPSLLLMENAGRGAAEIMAERFSKDRPLIAFCGPGNNGGDGFVIARHLHNAGWQVSAFLCGPEGKLSDDAATNFRILRAMDATVEVAADRAAQVAAAGAVSSDTIVLDALLGTGFHGDVRSPVAALIDDLNRTKKHALVAVDVPSGLDCETGKPANAAIRASLTVTFVAIKKGFKQDSARPFTGEVTVAGIGAPRELIDEIAQSDG